MTDEDIQGWFDFQHLYDWAVSHLPPAGNLIVELGPWRGKSTVYLANSMKRQGRTGEIVAIDTWLGSPGEKIFEYLRKRLRDPYGEFLSNIKACGVDDLIRPLQCDSIVAAAQFQNSSVDFLFIDTAHTYDQLTKELSVWMPKVKPGRTIAGHDIGIAEIAKAVSERLRGYNISGTSWHYKIPG